MTRGRASRARVEGPLRCLPVSAAVGSLLLGSGVSAVGCRTEDGARELSSRPAQGDAAPPAAVHSAFPLGAAIPEPRPGMVWVPKGALVAGTPPNAVPRIASEEMGGEQIILKGFYIDIYQYPNEEGGIPLTKVDYETAGRLCEAAGKRLCTELEWERACKGPSNHMYEYGDVYNAERCDTGRAQRLMPAGLRVGCQSDFGVRDMHGGAWEWTQSEWRRGRSSGKMVVRGGDGRHGDVVGRCANAAPRAPNARDFDLGFRCCAGELNTAVVNVSASGLPGFEGNTNVDQVAVGQVLDGLGERDRLQLGQPGEFSVTRSWTWRPVANEELLVFGGCSGIGAGQRCGVVIGRVLLGRVAFVAWAPSGEWLPSVHSEHAPSYLWLTGGTKAGSFRRLLRYSYGRVQVGPEEKPPRAPTPARRKSRRRVPSSKADR